MKAGGCPPRMHSAPDNEPGLSGASMKKEELHMKRDEDAAQEKDEGKKPKKHRGKKVLVAILVVLAVFIVMAAIGGNSSKPSSEPFDPANYQQVDYAKVAKTPDDYKDQKLLFVGSVAQVMEGSNETDIRLATGVSGYDDMVYVKIDNSVLGGNHLQEGQALGVYGTCTGQYHYTSALGVDVAIPGMVADQLDENVETPQQQMVDKVQALFEGASFEKADKGYGMYEYTATIANTTDQNLGNVSVILGLYDESGTRVDETYVSANSWAAGESAVFDATTTTDAAQVKAEIQTFQIGDDYYSAK